jgi:23S rRNA-/tRNA-specific pseudouridylate synthase
VTLLARLRALYPEASHRSFKQWLETGRVALNRRPCRDGRLELRPTDTVVLITRRVATFPRELTLIHEDDALLVVVKPRASPFVFGRSYGTEPDSRIPTT